MRKLIFAAAAALAAAAVPAHAVTVDPYDQITGPTPTVGNFAFGTVNPVTGAITPFTGVERPCAGRADQTCLRDVMTDLPLALGSGTAYESGTSNVPNDRVLLHPTSSAFAGLTFFATLAGSYTFTGAFSIQDDFPTGVDTGAVILNGAAILPSMVLSSGSRAFNFTTTLGAGDGVSFFVGPAGNFTFDSTGLSLQVSSADPVVAAVPEPATWLMLILGFGIVGGTLRSRRRNRTALAA